MIASPTISHICEAQFRHLPSMREFYSMLGVYPTSINGDIALVRSHIAYHSGSAKAESVIIKKSRGDTYRVYRSPRDKTDFTTVRVINAYDHRAGVTGWSS